MSQFGMMSFSKPSAKSQSSNVGIINQKYRRGYKVPLLDHMKDDGIRPRTLWPSRNHVIRIIPGYDPETGEIFRQNIHENEFSDEQPRGYYLSGTFLKAPVISKFGTVPSPIISAYPPGSKDDEMYAGDTVLRAFVRGITYACGNKATKGRLKATKDWHSWTARGKEGILTLDRESLLMQALVFIVNDQANIDYQTKQELRDEDGDIKPVLSLVIIDNQTSINNLVDALVLPADRRKPLDAATNNQYGAMAELEGNKLFLNTYTDPEHGTSALRPSVQAGGEGWTATPYVLGEDAVRALWHPWDDLLQPLMTAAEQVDLCVHEFGAETVNYVIGSDPRLAGLIPDEVRAIGIGKYAMLDGGSVTLSSQGATQIGPAKSAAKGLGTPKGLGVKKVSNVPADMPMTTVDVNALMEATKAIRNASGSSPADDAMDILGNPLLEQEDE